MFLFNIPKKIFIIYQTETKNNKNIYIKST